ncbi:MAG: hypothetical protein H7174_03610 [Flavobacterium sp.]|nr:hypothetical protein [Flavobacterium sp.]
MTNNGTKISIQESSVRLISFDKKILYKNLNNGSEQSISFDDFDCIYYNNFKFKSIGLNKRKEKDGFFILAESAEKFLLLKMIISKPQEEDEEASKPSYQLLIVDNQFNTLSTFAIDDQNNSKCIDARNQIVPNVKTFFPNCDDLLNRLSDYDKKNGDLKNQSILGIFNSPVFIECK